MRPRPFRLDRLIPLPSSIIKQRFHFHNPARSFAVRRPISSLTMSSSKFQILSPPTSPAVFPKFTTSSTSTVNALLQQNHDNLHIFWDYEDRLHNHIAHHLLAIYALGGTESNLQFAYETNIKNQLPIGDQKPPVLQDLSSSDSWDKYLGEAELYNTFLTFFQSQIDKNGWQSTVDKYIFSEKAARDGMPERLVAGFLHPWIHLGYGVEFEQPALIAEALAQTAVHDSWTSDYLKKCSASAKPELRATMTSLFAEARESEKLRSAAKWTDPQKNKAVYANAMDEMVALASRWFVKPDSIDAELRRAAAELVSASVQMMAGTPRKDKKVKFDFFLMHCVTSSVFLDVWVRQEGWVDTAKKAMLLNYFGWMVANMYVSRGCAEVDLAQVEGYVGKESRGGKPDWESIISRAVKLKDDGHVPKTIRSLMNGEKLTNEYLGQDGFEFKGDLCVKAAEMVIDSLEDCGKDEPSWVRSVGHEGAWEKVGPRVEYGQKSEL